MKDKFELEGLNLYTYNGILNDTNVSQLNTGEDAAKMGIISHIEVEMEQIREKAEELKEEWRNSSMTYEVYQSDYQYLLGELYAYNNVLKYITGDKNEQR